MLNSVKFILIRLLILFIPISSILVFPQIKGSTPSYLILLILNLIFLIRDIDLAKKFFIFIVFFSSYYLFSQFILFIFNGFDTSLLQYSVNELNYNFTDSIAVSKVSNDNFLFRGTHFTQFLYLLMSVSCFLIYRKYYRLEYAKYIYVASYLIFLYGLLLFFLFLIYGYCIDFFSNISFGNILREDLECSYGYQVATFNDYSFHRVKSFSNEASMYVLTAFPYVIFAFFQKKYFLTLLGLISLILTFSSTFYIISFLLLILYFLHNINFKKLNYLFLTIFIISLLIIFNYDFFDYFIFSKIEFARLSGIHRFAEFQTAINLFAEIPFFSKIFGIGFGTIRTADIFSTLLINIGIVGVLIFLYFVLRPLFIINKVNISVGMNYCLLSIILCLFVSVPEFAILTSWFYFGIAYNVNNLPLERHK